MFDVKLTSWGATEEVTGSCHLLKINNYRLLIDCGLWQGSWESYLKNWDEFGFDPSSLDAVILTHAHLDHCGRLPKLYAQGYKGKVYTTEPSIKLAQIVLKDNYHITQEKARYHKLPQLYSLSDLNKVDWQAVNYYQTIQLGDDISFSIHNAGHILGAGIIELKIGGRIIVFSGDIGGENMPLVKDVDYLKKADYVITESTYGNRLHEDLKDRNEKLLEAVKRTVVNNSTLLISIFAIERTQDILKVLNDYYENHLDFNVPVFLDSPMAASATRIYKQSIKYLNQAAQDTLNTDNDLFNFPHLKITNQVRKSKQINAVAPPKIIMAGSGMAEGGRVLHHLARYVKDAKNTILFIGFQVPGTLGHKLINGTFNFDYYGKSVPIKAAVDQIDGFSAHADQAALLKWLGSFKKPKKVFLSHGNKEVMEEYAKTIQAKLKFDTLILKKGESIKL